MQRYKVTAANKAALFGRIKKFWKSCAKNMHVYKFGREIVFPYLTDEQVKNALYAFPVKNTCKFNGLRCGDTVRFYGGNKIVVLGRRNEVVAEFVRIVPNDETTVLRFIGSLSAPMSTNIPAEFWFDRVIMSTAKKNYATLTPVKEANLTQPMQELKELSQKATSPITRYEDLPDELKYLFWDGKEPITKLSDMDEIEIDAVSARAALLRAATSNVRQDLTEWGLDTDKFLPVMLSYPDNKTDTTDK